MVRHLQQSALTVHATIRITNKPTNIYKLPFFCQPDSCKFWQMAPVYFCFGHVSLNSQLQSNAFVCKQIHVHSDGLLYDKCRHLLIINQFQFHCWIDFNLPRILDQYATCKQSWLVHKWLRPKCETFEELSVKKMACHQLIMQRPGFSY